MAIPRTRGGGRRSLQARSGAEDGEAATFLMGEEDRRSGKKVAAAVAADGGAALAARTPRPDQAREAAMGRCAPGKSILASEALARRRRSRRAKMGRTPHRRTALQIGTAGP